MQIIFATNDIQAEANSFLTMVSIYGEVKARKIRQRLDEITAAANLEDLAKLPATGCHCLEENKTLIGVMTLKPFCLLFDIAKNFDTSLKVTNAVWRKVILIEIMSLDREIK